MSDHYVLVGLARSRQTWFNELARWATMAIAPIEYLKCLGAEEVLAVLGTGRRVSALFADAGAAALDRELIASLAAVGVPTVVVGDGATWRDWEALGAVAVLPADFDRDLLVRTLEAHAQPVDATTRRPARARLVDDTRGAPSAMVVSVVAGGGAGGSTISMAVAQAMAGDRPAGRVALVDGARRSDLGMLLDIGDVIPGLPDLVEAHRLDEPDPDEVRSCLFQLDARGHDLLLGHRRPHDWTAMPARSVHAALWSLVRIYDVVVVDHDRDLDGEELTGSVDIEDRHAVARWTVRNADVVLAVGGPAPQQVHDLLRLLDELLEAGAPPERIRPVVNRAPASRSRRLVVTRAIAQLAGGPGDGEHRIAAPAFVPRLRRLESCHHHERPLPTAICTPVARAVHQVLEDAGRRRRDLAEPAVLIEPGELGLLEEPARFGMRSGAA